MMTFLAIFNPPIPCFVVTALAKTWGTQWNMLNNLPVFKYLNCTSIPLDQRRLIAVPYMPCLFLIVCLTLPEDFVAVPLQVADTSLRCVKYQLNPFADAHLRHPPRLDWGCSDTKKTFEWISYRSRRRIGSAQGQDLENRPDGRDLPHPEYPFIDGSVEGDPGVITMMFYIPKYKIGIISFGNTNPGKKNIEGYNAIWKLLAEYAKMSVNP